jgi:hypothetical protein
VNIKIKKEIKTQHKKFSLINKLVLNLVKNEATSNVANRSKRIMLVMIRSIIKNFRILNEFALDLMMLQRDKTKRMLNSTHYLPW